MLFVAIFEDSPGMSAVRQANGAAHIEHLKRHAKEIRVGGGLRTSPDAPFSGGMWILDVDSRDRAVALIESDPYYEPAHRRYRLYHWNKVQDCPVEL
ncbi:YciI family protein [Hydrogenophaga sp. 5NK40-0174]|uniref:YciI family protein n=1 Tax=Hydrogenophaga sp. 5NK40-0174 TaxID=3127649 RepID=UPI003106F6C6